MPILTSQSITKSLLTWYDAHARILPWRVSPQAAANSGPKPDPYRIWLSEVMLQQTTVATVKPRFIRFVDLWPSVADLAAAPVEDVLAEWAGLGYYARARNLTKCAQMVVKEYGGAFPVTEHELLALPGVGPYTAAAIAAIAFDQPAVVVDGNIERVMTRMFALRQPIAQSKEKLRAHAACLTPTNRPGDYAQALMDIGATICTPRNPLCALCPLSAKCMAFKQGIAAELPLKNAKSQKPVRRAHIYVALTEAGAVRVERRPAEGLLGGMLGLPTSPWPKQGQPDYQPPCKGAWQKAGEMRHTFTHFHLDIQVWQALMKETSDHQWTRDFNTMPTLFRKAIALAMAPSE